MESRARVRSRVGDVSRGLSSQTIPCWRDPARHGSPLVTCHNEIGPFSCRLLNTSSRRTLPARFIRLKDVLTDIAIFSIRTRFCFAWNRFAKGKQLPLFPLTLLADRHRHRHRHRHCLLYYYSLSFLIPFSVRSSNGLFFATKFKPLLRLHIS